jgi:hypothetical protein
MKMRGEHLSGATLLPEIGQINSLLGSGLIRWAIQCEAAKPRNLAPKPPLLFLLAGARIALETACNLVLARTLAVTCKQRKAEKHAEQWIRTHREQRFR